MVLQVLLYSRGRQNGTASIVQSGLLQFANEHKACLQFEAPMVWVCLAFSGPKPTRDYSISGSSRPGARRVAKVQAQRILNKSLDCYYVQDRSSTNWKV